MSVMKIGVTGVGGGAGQSILKALQGTEYQLVGLDGEVLGTGLYTTPFSYKIPYANSKEFIPVLLKICEKEQIKLLFPGLDAELAPLSKSVELFAAIGTIVVVSKADVIKISDDKLYTYQRLTELGFRVPYTISLSNYINAPTSIPFPVIIKQQIGGARSKNVFLVKNAEQYASLLKLDLNYSEYIVQEYIEGDEYTCGSVNLNESCKGVIVMRRILRDGDTYKCFSERNEQIEKTIHELLSLIKPFGACNVQLRMRNGVPYIFEINSRCSGTTAARALCGFNEPKSIADFLLKSIEPAFDVKELTVLRYWKELVVENALVSEFKERGMLVNRSGYGL